MIPIAVHLPVLPHPFQHNPATEISGALAPRPEVKHFAATRLLALTFVRTGEVRGAQWSEFDLDAGLWVIPAERMKAREPHTVPLSSRAVEVIRRALQPLTGHLPGLFPSRNRDGGIISENTVLKVIERIGYKGRRLGTASTPDK